MAVHLGGIIRLMLLAALMPCTGSAESEPTPPQRALLHRDGLVQQDIQRYLQQYQLTEQWQVLTSEHPWATALWQPYRTASPQGGAILVHSPGQHSLWPSALTELAQTLPDMGWSTLSLILPDYPVWVTSPPAAGEAVNSPTAQDDENTPASEPVATQDALSFAQQQLSNAQAQLDNAGLFNRLFIGYGQGVHLLAAFLAQQQPPMDGRANALIMLQAQTHPKLAPPLTERLRQLAVPVLDVYSSDSLWQQRQAQSRRTAVQQTQAGAYQALALPATHLNAYTTASPHALINRSSLSRRVQGWVRLNRLGREVELTDTP